MAKPILATIFAYQVGFGDCFLVRYSYDDTTQRHMLFDFGTTGLPEDADDDHMLKVAQDIAGRCGARGLDVLVATHRHADHISGFATRADGKGTGDVIASLRPKVVVQPWTESPDAPIDWLGPEASANPTAFTAHRNALSAMNDVARVALGMADSHRLPAALAGQIGFIGEVNLANRSAIDNLQAMGKAGEERYVFHGCDINLDAILPGIKIEVLGPPTLRQTETIRKQTSSNKDEFWQLQLQQMSDAARLSTSSNLFPDAPFHRKSKLLVEHRWLARRIDELHGELTLGLVRELDKQMNNTSVVLLIQAGSKAMLFPGDAQLENWQYTLQSDKAKLLDDVDVYKVGHHGSRNASPHSMWAHFRKRGKASTPDRLTALLSTRHGKHGSEDKKTEVPRQTLVDELDALSHLFTTEALPDGQLFHQVDIDLR